jgi:CRP/FNR family transcriptional regulator, cyclic AMP receptor protein
MDAESRPIFLPLDRGPAGLPRRLMGSLGRERALRQGETLLREGQPSPVLYLISAGVLMAELTSRSGRPAVVALLAPGELCGESALPADPSGTEGDPVVPRIWAVVPSRVLVVDPARLREAARSDERVRDWITARLVGRVGRAEALLARTLSLSVAERVERAIEDLASAGLDGLGSPVVTQELLARMTGATRESVNRALAGLSAAGRVTRSGRGYRTTGRALDQTRGSDARTSSKRSPSEPSIRTTRPSPSSLSR